MNIEEPAEFVCTETGCACSDSDECTCDKCKNYRNQKDLVEFLANQRIKLAEKMRRLAARHSRVPESCACYIDLSRLYAWTAEEMLIRLAKGLKMPPDLIKLEMIDHRQAPAVNLDVREWWAREQFAEQFATMDKAEMRIILDQHCRGHVMAEQAEFDKAWKTRLEKLGYLSEQQN